jgi:molybdate transport system regulatory protein
MTLQPLKSTLMLGRGPTGKVGADRIALVETIAQEGSITKAAKRLGVSYRAAWDAVQALNNLFDEPLITASPGGASGGVAGVTPRGLKLAAAYRRMEARLAEAWAEVDADGADLWSLGMKTSARNALRGTVEAITGGAVNSEVVLTIAPGVTVTSIITKSSVEDLHLKVGSPAIALIKSSFIILAVGSEPLKTSARNQLFGKVTSREDGAVNSEIIIDLAAGKTLAATLTKESAEILDLKPGDPVIALIKAPHVILAVE